jgi:ketosteroid isomerase-like protein
VSQENVEIAVGYFEATEFSGAIDALADEVTFLFHGESRHLAGAETLSGKAAAVEWLADWFSRFDSAYRMEVTEVRDWGERVLVVTTHHAKGRASKVPISQTTGQVITIANGKIVRQDFFAGRSEALEAAGLSE